MSYKLIESAYKMIDNYTPLKHDCGRMCNDACCHSDGSMLLFPYEYELLKGEGYSFSTVDLDGFEGVWSIRCSGVCNRDKRPLACRIFPLAPKVTSSEVKVVLDARGRSVCPLTHGSILSLDAEFVWAVKKTLNMLSSDDTIARYLRALSDLTDKYKVGFL